MTLALRYVEDHKAAADQYPRAIPRSPMSAPYPRDAFKLVHSLITETTNDIRNFKGGEEAAARIDVVPTADRPRRDR